MTSGAFFQLSKTTVESTIPSFICGSVARYYTGRVLDWKQHDTNSRYVFDAYCLGKKANLWFYRRPVCAAQCYGHCIGITDLHPVHWCYCSPSLWTYPTPLDSARIITSRQVSQAATWTGTLQLVLRPQAMLEFKLPVCKSPTYEGYIRQSKQQC